MKVTFATGGRVLVQREPADKRIAKESTFWHALREQLNRSAQKRSDRFRRVRPERGGYGLTSMPYALWRDGLARERREPMLIGDADYAIRLAHETFNAGGPVTLTIF